MGGGLVPLEVEITVERLLEQRGSGYLIVAF